MIGIMLISAVAIVIVVMMHFEGLTALNRFANATMRLDRPHLVVAILMLLALHLLEICVFSGAMYVSHHVLHLGEFKGDRVFTASDYFHFSAETFTTAGYGDLYPVGDLRLLAALESLTGVLLIAWSGAFSYFAVQRLWDSEK